MWFALHLVRKGLISSDQFVDLIERRLRSRPPLGQLAMKCGKLSMRQIFQVLSAQAETQAPFGQVALDLGLLNEPDLAQLLMLQEELTTPTLHLLLELGVAGIDLIQQEYRQFHRKHASQPMAAPLEAELVAT